MTQGFSVGCMGPMAPWSSGGVSVHVAELTKVLSRDHVVRVVTPGPGRGTFRAGAAEVRVAHQFPVTPLPPWDFLPEFRASLTFLRGMTILHAHDPRLSLAAKFLERPLVTTFHGYLTFEAMANTRTRPGRPLYELYDRIVRSSVEGSDRAIAVDGRIAAWLRREYAATAVDVIPNGVDTDRFHPRLDGRAFREAYGVSPNAPLILGAKHFVAKNGMDVLVRAMPHVRREVPEAVLFLAGRGERERLIRRLVAELGLASSTRLPGLIPHESMPRAIGACDVCVVPSVPVAGVEEATSILALEAMAAGKAVVASDLGGLREIISDGDSGILVPPGDPTALAAAIVELLQNPERRQAIGRRARTYVEEHHSWTSIGARVQAVYERVLG